jgi:hypothetical protein
LGFSVLGIGRAFSAARIPNTIRPSTTSVYLEYFASRWLLSRY